MLLDKSRVLITCAHHRRLPLFEESTRVLYNNGYKNIVIIDTGNESWGKYQGPQRRLCRFRHLNYDQAVVQLKTGLLKDPIDFDTMLMIDNDMFIQDTSSIDLFLSRFVDNEFDLCGHITNPNLYETYSPNDSELFRLSDIDFTFDRHGLPSPVPNLHTVNMAITKKLWDDLKEEDVNHNRKLIHKAWQLKAKIGANWCVPMSSVSLCHKDWFHLGNVMKYCYLLEQGKVEKFNPDSCIDMSRLGFFLYQRDQFGLDIYPRTVIKSLETLISTLGEDNPNQAWQKLIQDTCLHTAV